MTKSEFEQLVAEKKARRPIWFELESESPCSEEDIASLEAVLGAHLAPEFRDFLATHGAGMFAFLKVLGVKRGTSWELASHRHGLPVDFVPVGDLETGDYYGHKVVDGQCEPTVSVWDHETSAIQPTQYDDFYSLVAAVGLKIVSVPPEMP